MKTHFTNILSTQFGRFASYSFPKVLQNFINNSYVNLLNLDMSEFEDASSFKSLNALFTRSLKAPREIKCKENDFISPSDSLISTQDRIYDGVALQIKGFSYKIDELLGENFSAKQKDALQNGTFINLYLSPKDYHRFHAPLDMKVLKAVHISQKLYPVNFTYLNKIESLFCKNERVILECESLKGLRFYLIFVGALNVGKIIFNFDKNISTNASFGTQKVYEYENLEFKQADELGRFEMGSTIVILFESKDIKLAKRLEKVRFGDIIANF